ncbi:MAG: hypothetical protein JWP30_123 [Homoserinimonas sp.]|jgi:hypothetical protein|nr:hypothetical protein [Homoserinimonas sp.]
MPAVVLVLVFCLGGLRLGAEQLRLQDAAAEAARQISRGEPLESVAERVRGLVPGAALATADRQQLVCVSVGSGNRLLAFGSVLTLAATSCALRVDP